MMENKIKDICANEVLTVLNKVKEYSLSDINYFCDIAEKYYKKDIVIENKPAVIVMGTCFPREILETFNLNYLYIPGGSFSASVQCDNIVPRDTDYVSRR